MSALAPTLQAFFAERLIAQRRASPHTIASYRDTIRLLLEFAQQRTGKQPSSLEIADLDAELIAAFLTHLEHDRRNSARTRNARLGAIHSLYRYTALRHPEHAELIGRVLAIPAKRSQRAVISYLNRAEIDALLARGLAWISFTPSTAHAPSSCEDTNADPRSTRTASGTPRAISPARSAASGRNTSSPVPHRHPTNSRE
jgi:site-specific recombinase XerD